MNTVFPVEVEVAAETGERRTEGLLQAFTRDVSLGGMCIELKTFSKGGDELFTPACRLFLTINPSFSKKPIHAQARVAWLQREDHPAPVRYLIGVAYTDIDERARKRIFRYAKRLFWLPRLAVASGLAMLLLLAGAFVQGQRLSRENGRLVSELVESAARKSDVASSLYQLQKRKIVLDQELSRARGQITTLNAAISSMNSMNAQQKAQYERRIADAVKRQKRLDLKLGEIEEGQERLQAEYKSLQAVETPGTQAVFRQMHEWIRSHRNLKTGLVASYEGDPKLEDWAFTYDQSLASQVFLLFGDAEAASSVLSFYDRAATEQGAFFNAYDAVDGTPQEPVVRTGPNVWIGIAALQYEHRVRDGRFLPLAKRIGAWVLSQQDSEGGVKGGPNVVWYSTEHNLDAYAFFRMLYLETKDSTYQKAADRSLDWIKKYAYTNKERRMQRGKGDSTIATDTFSWAVAAIGPETLKRIDLDPEGIMEFAEKNCGVAASFVQPNGKTAIAKGFDFAKAQNLGRGGIISTEWTAQVVVTFEVMSRYFRSLGDAAKAELYKQKADFYLSELQKLIITSPSRTGQGRGCLPYASADNADTGHGWRTPAGKRTGSVAGTAYGLFAWVGYNPFDLESSPKAP